MGNKPKDELVDEIFRALRKYPRSSTSDLALKAGVHNRTVDSWVKLIIRIQAEKKIGEMKTTGGSVYSLKE